MAALAAGALSLVSVASTTDVVLSAAATGGTAPYTYQWYRSTTNGFSPGAGSLIAGAVALTLNDSGLIPNTQYYYLVVVTDNVSATATSAQLGVLTGAATQNINSFTQSPQLGMIDQRFDYNTMPVQVDVSQVGALFAGSAVKMVDSLDGVPKVVGCSANADNVLGFINFDIKSQTFVAGSRAELSRGGNVIYLYATGAIARGHQVQLDLTSPGGVAQSVGSSGANIVGWAMDKAATAGVLIRVSLTSPSFASA